MSAAIWRLIPGTTARMSDDGIVVDADGNELDAPRGTLHLRDVHGNAIERDLERTYDALFPASEDDVLETLGVRPVPHLPGYGVTRSGLVLRIEMHKWLHSNERGEVRLGSRQVSVRDLVAAAWGHDR